MSKAFRNGERDFVKDEIVFVVDKLDNLMNILIGKVDAYAGDGKYYIDLYTVAGNRDDIDENLYIEIGDDAGIREWINKGYLVLRSSVEDYHKKNPDSPLYIVERKDNIFHYWKNSIDEFNRRKEDIEAEVKRRSNMTEYQICRENIAVFLKGCNLFDEEIFECLNLIDKNDSLPDMENIDVRRFGNEVQWKNGGKWEKLMSLDRPEEEKHSEKYYADIYHIWDLDRTPVFRGYTNETPESLFEKYGDCTEYVFGVCNKEWNIEKGLEIPCRYVNVVVGDENGKLKSVLATVYSTEHGSFSLVDGELRHFDISIDYKHSVNTFWISVLAKTKMNDQEIREWFSKRIGKVTGRFEKLFKQKIQDLEIRVWK
ncbi:MAG TPA: hypothetical protein DCW90_10445 [Lachnospiraceae bacterium]|nr:hypothetical protein [Lachnospiraceae bacterium]